MYSPPPFHWNNTQGLFDSQIGNSSNAFFAKHRTSMCCTSQTWKCPTNGAPRWSLGECKSAYLCIWSYDGVVNFSMVTSNSLDFFYPNLWIIQTKRQTLLAFFCTSSHFKLAPRKKKTVWPPCHKFVFQVSPTRQPKQYPKCQTMHQLAIGMWPKASPQTFFFGNLGKVIGSQCNYITVYWTYWIYYEISHIE